VLVVEDSPTQKEQLLYLLERAGYATCSAVDGVAALEIERKVEIESYKER